MALALFLAPYGAENGTIAIWHHLNDVIAIAYGADHRHMAPYDMKSFRKLSIDARLHWLILHI